MFAFTHCAIYHFALRRLIVSNKRSWSIRGGFIHEPIDKARRDYGRDLDCVRMLRHPRVHLNLFVFQIHEHMTREEMLSVFYTGHESGNNGEKSNSRVIPSALFFFVPRFIRRDIKKKASGHQLLMRLQIRVKDNRMSTLIYMKHLVLTRCFIIKANWMHCVVRLGVCFSAVSISRRVIVLYN